VAELIAGAGLEQYYEVRSGRPQRPDQMVLADDAWSAYAQPEVAAGIVSSSGNLDRATLGVDGMRCAACAWLIDKMVGKRDGVVRVSVNAATARVHVEWQRDKLNLADVMRSIARAGYRPFPPGDAHVVERQQQERRTALRHLAVSGFGMMQVMMFAFAAYSAQIRGEAIDPTLLEFFRLVSMLLAVPVMFYAGLPIFANAWRALISRSLGMDVPVALALLLAFSASVWNAFRGNTGEVYFDSVTMFIFFVTLGRFIQMSVRHRTTSITDALARQMPSIAHRLEHDAPFDVPVAALRPGDTVLVRRGEVLPADGELLDAHAQLDESLLTGESVADRRQRGHALSGGSVNVGNPLRMTVTTLAQASTLAHVVALMQRAQAQRPRITAAADAASVRFLWTVVSAAALTAVTWWFVDSARAFDATLAVLVVACPCAFAIAIPAAVSAAIANLARRGVLVTHPDALERLAVIDHAVFDKTGTLTRGQIRLSRRIVADGADEAHCLAVAAALEAASEHPIARAIGRSGTAVAADVMTVAGAGIEGTVQGRRYRIGTPQFVTAWHRDGAATLAPAAADVTLVTLGDATRVLMQFELADELRERVPDAIDALRRHGVVASILSGDRRSSVDAVADACGITKRFAAYSPERKLAHLQSLQQQGHRVLMLGDGVNDAPVLAAADVSIAMGRGTALAHASADMILTAEDLNAVPQAIAVARRMRRIARQNLCWAAAWNFGSLPLAALGFIPPWAAALGMSLSSILVVMNATRLLPRESDDGRKATATRSAPSLAPSIIVARGVSS
jgi:Cu2+-exporting ATPase